MTKEEKIKEAWGEHYEQLKINIDIDGWIDSAWISDLEIDLEIKDGFDRYGTESTFIRPKSLQGIENNNGWIKIESEEDLPKDHDQLFEVGLLEREGNFTHERKRCSGKSVKWMWDKKLITHYQPIVKPKPPIY